MKLAIKLAIALLVVCTQFTVQAQFIRGFANADLSVNISDVTRTIGYLFLGSSPLAPLDAMDVHDDGVI